MANTSVIKKIIDAFEDGRDIVYRAKSANEFQETNCVWFSINREKPIWNFEDYEYDIVKPVIGKNNGWYYLRNFDYHPEPLSNRSDFGKNQWEGVYKNHLVVFSSKKEAEEMSHKVRVILGLE